MAQLVQEWLKELGHPRRTALADHQKHLAWIADATLNEQDQIEWLVTSAVIRTWLIAQGFRILSVTAETAPETTFSPISYALAVLAQSLIKSQWFPVLTYACGLRCWQPGAPRDGAALAMLSSLTGQLLEEINAKMPDFDYTTLHCQSHTEAFGTVQGVLSLLKDLLDAFPSGSAVFILIDSLSCLEMMDRKGSETAMQGLFDIISVSAIPVKIAITDSLFFQIPPTLNIKRDDIYLPDDIDGDRNGYHAAVEQVMSQTVAEHSQNTLP